MHVFVFTHFLSVSNRWRYSPGILTTFILSLVYSYIYEYTRDFTTDYLNLSLSFAHGMNSVIDTTSDRGMDDLELETR